MPTVCKMASTGEGYVLKALKSRTKRLCVDNCSLKVISSAIGRLLFLERLSAKTNSLETLPKELANLTELVYFNLGCNKFHEIPDCVLDLPKLSTLHLFKNCIATIPEGLPKTLIVLNLNDNQISSIPSSINHLSALKQLSLANNNLSHLPTEICSLHTLQELCLNDNHLSYLPKQLGKLVNLKTLLLQKNSLQCLPHSVRSLKKLSMLDISCNQLEMFPGELENVPIQELYFENNPLVPYIPVPSEQCIEVLQLKEAVSRFLVSEIKKDDMLLSTIARYHQDIYEQLSTAGECTVCRQPFINMWLDCVRFELPKKVFKNLRNSSPGLIPLKAPLCSYKCFNTDGHKLYGIAAPPSYP